MCVYMQRLRPYLLRFNRLVSPFSSQGKAGERSQPAVFIVAALNAPQEQQHSVTPFVLGGENDA